MLLIRSFLKALFLPPGLLIFAGLLGFLLLSWRPRVARLLLLFSLLGSYLFSTPALVILLSDSLEDYPSLSIDDVRLKDAGAIVVLGGGSDKRLPEYGGDVVKIGALNRVLQGAYLHKQTKLPLLLTGGVGRGSAISEAQLMAQTLKKYSDVEARWLERRSRTTLENAQNSAEILLPQNIQKIVLVTEAYHMDRSLHSFERMGFEVIPAPAGYSSSHMKGWELMDFLPSAKSFDLNYKLIHERVGLVAYRFMYE
ncbi:MAG: YdcF family protein [Pseudomonadales bacterium]|nr:YdcF family protein [Pseudomonadales bacterium]